MSDLGNSLRNGDVSCLNSIDIESNPSLAPLFQELPPIEFKSISEIDIGV